jgi:hypothetical protein
MEAEALDEGGYEIKGKIGRGENRADDEGTDYDNFVIREEEIEV